MIKLGRKKESKKKKVKKYCSYCKKQTEHWRRNEYMDYRCELCGSGLLLKEDKKREVKFKLDEIPKGSTLIKENYAVSKTKNGDIMIKVLEKKYKKKCRYYNKKTKKCRLIRGCCFKELKELGCPAKENTEKMKPIVTKVRI